MHNSRTVYRYKESYAFQNALLQLSIMLMPSSYYKTFYGSPLSVDPSLMSSHCSIYSQTRDLWCQHNTLLHFTFHLRGVNFLAGHTLSCHHESSFKTRLNSQDVVSLHPLPCPHNSCLDVYNSTCEEF